MKRLRCLAVLTFVLAWPAAARAVPAFTLESSVRLSSAQPQAVTGALPSEIRLFFLRDFKILSATSTDGLSFSEETGVRVSSTVPGNAISFSSVTSAGVLPLAAGGYRMAFSVIDSSGNYRVATATSSDGLAWRNESGTGFPLPTGIFAGSVRLAPMTGSNWRMFYVRATSVGFSSSTFRVFTATSADEGQTWGASTQIYTDEAHGIGVGLLTGGGVRIYYTVPLTGQTTATQILSAVSTSVITPDFVKEASVVLSTDVAQGAFLSPVPARGDPDHTWRLYHAFLPVTSTTPVTMSALADSPDPGTISPASASNAAAAASHVISGEIFSSTVTVSLQRAGEPDIAGTDVVRNSDRSVSATFDTQNRALGTWDVVVTNSDAKSGKIANGFTIDIDAGQLTIVDNVFRPLKGQKASIGITIFGAGRVTVKLYTLEGRLVRTLNDGDLPVGTTTLPWDATNDDGHLVASGVYLLEAKGPKLNTRQKIVVIK